jgi:hypothetical protein
VQHEPGKQGDKGAPDFRVSKAGQIIGYVENKRIGEKLSSVLKSEQIKKYKALSENIILTNYLDFVWIEGDKTHDAVSLAHEADIGEGKVKLRPENAATVEKLLNGFFSTPPVGIGRAQKLAVALAVRSHLLRDFLVEELVRQEKEHKEGRLFGLYGVFKQQVFHELTLKEFADAFAQTLSYGLFLAKLNAENQTITLDNARTFVPGTFRLIRELVQFLDELTKPEYREIKWVVEEILSIVTGLDIGAIHEDLAFKSRKAISRKVKAKDEEEWRLFSRDPFVYFYEDFLAKYDKDMKKSRGVYYTPPPIVNFIVRSIDDILKEKFEIAAGLADHKRVTVLDFACGTGTFLLEVFQQIFENIGGEKSGAADLVVREHILTNVYGFEYLIAPYTVAHLKLSQFLKDKGHPLAEDERLQVFLTNTLEPIKPQKELLLPAVTAEVEAAQEVKDRPILVITGNPPYSYQSRNTGEWITALLQDYRLVDGKPLEEKVTQGLLDDYVKFIRFAQYKMETEEEGVVGVITNHSWLDNPTFRGMRQSLMETFNQIYVLDLHGNAKKKETAPDGSKDENVFDIEQGVAISLFIRKQGLERGIWRGDLWGKRLDKYRAAVENKLINIDWKQIAPLPPFYLIAPFSVDFREEYSAWHSLPDLFSAGGSGMMTSRDHLTIRFSVEDVWRTVNRFVSLSEEDARVQFKLGKDARDWRVQRAQEDLRLAGPNKSHIKPVQYRPFDTRYTYYTGRARGFIGWPVADIWRNMLRPNIALAVSRMTKGESFGHTLVSTNMIEKISLSSKTSNNAFVFPIHGDEGKENFSPTFREFLDARYNHHYIPEEILGYVYAVLNAPAYRKRYAEFLRIDFPRIPFPEAKTDFDLLSKLGWELAHRTQKCTHFWENPMRKHMNLAQLSARKRFHLLARCASAGASPKEIPPQEARQLSWQGHARSGSRALFATGASDLDQQDAALHTGAGGRVELPHRRLSGAR